MTTQDELRGFDNAVRQLSFKLTLEMDEVIMGSKTKELASKEIDLIARELICIAETIKNLCSELKKEAALANYSA